MSAVQAVLVVGISGVVIWAMIAVMMRLERVQRRRIQRRREAWKATGGEGSGPDDYMGSGGSLNIGTFGR